MKYTTQTVLQPAKFHLPRGHEHHKECKVVIPFLPSNQDCFMLIMKQNMWSSEANISLSLQSLAKQRIMVVLRQA